MTHHMSIKQKITLFYTATILVITTFFLVIMWATSGYLTQSVVLNKLRTVAEWAEYSVRVDTEGIGLDSSINEIVDAFVLIYDAHGDLFYGKANDEVIALPFDSDGHFRSVRNEKGSFYVYDMRPVFLGLDEKEDIWIRTYLPASSLEGSKGKSIVMGALLVLILAILSLTCGHYITKWVFKPVAAIEATARGITEDADLSKRIPVLHTGTDELNSLIETFNHMLQKLEITLAHEKQFTSDVSHELRTPLTVAITQGENLARRFEREGKLTQEEKENKEAVAVILKQCRIMQKLVSELLTISRMENDRLVLSTERVNLSELACMVSEELEEEADEKNIDILVNPSKDVWVEGDQTLLMCVFVNLISNAIRYGKAGGHIWIDVECANGKARCQIKDDGIGIDEKHLERIWDRFYRVDTSRSTEGFGLGLFMVKWIITRYGGKIEVHSEANKGSVFSIELEGVSTSS